MKRSDRHNDAWLCIGASAIMLHLAFFAPRYFCWMVFVFLVPLFYIALRRSMPLQFKHGFFWGLLFFSTHWYGLVRMIIDRGCSTTKYGLCLFLIIYAAIQTGIWFWLVAMLIQKGVKTWWYAWLCWTVISYGYFIWLWHGMFFIMGQYGYCFGLILLPLAEYPLALSLLPVVGTYGLLACQLGVAACLSLALLKSRVWLISAVALLLPFVWGYIPMHTSDEDVTYYDYVGYVQPPVYGSKHWLDCAQTLSARINQLLERRPGLLWVIMPESTYPFCLNKYPEAVELLTDFERNSDTQLLMGAYKNEDTCLYNSVYVLSHNAIKSCYDKTARVPFVEYIPRAWRLIPGFDTLFFKDYKEFSFSKNRQGAFAFCTTACIPYVCSDLFLQEPLYQQDEAAVLLLCVNDSWFSDDYIPHLMYLFAKCYALAHRRSCCYVSHTRALWINKYGYERKLLE